MPRQDSLEKAAHPLITRPLEPWEYRVLGADIVHAVLRSSTVQENHSIGVTETNDHTMLTWWRDRARYALFGAGNETYMLEATVPVADRLVMKDIFVFGDEEVAKGGLVHVLHDVSASEKTPFVYRSLSKRNGNWRKDGKGPLRVPPTRLVKAVFKNTLLTIVERPSTKNI